MDDTNSDTTTDFPIEPSPTDDGVIPNPTVTVDGEKFKPVMHDDVEEKKELAIDPKSTATPEQVKEVMTLGQWHSVKQLSTALNFGRAYINLLITQGRIKAVKILGGQWRIPHSEYERLTKEGIVPMRLQKDKTPPTRIITDVLDDTVEKPTKSKEKKDEVKPEEKPKERFPGFRFNFLGK